MISSQSVFILAMPRNYVDNEISLLRYELKAMGKEA
jgi:hypothetical protein